MDGEKESEKWRQKSMNLPKDKLLHFGAGLVISLVVGTLTVPLYGVIASLVAGVGKEVWDSRGHGTVEVLDVVATLFGGVVGAILMGVV